MPYTTFEPQEIEDAKGKPNSTEYGFVVDHPAYWGIPIPGFGDPAPTSDDSVDVGKLVLNVKAELISPQSSKWSNGQIKVLATRMPPLFHALHHNTLVHAPKSFIPRDERGSLPEAGERALVGLCNLDFDSNGLGKANVIRDSVAMSEFYKKPKHGMPLIQRAKDWGYFEVESKGVFVWDTSKVGPLGALWIVLLNEDGTPAWFDEHLGGGYRLWHYKSHNANRNFFNWNFQQSQDKKNIQVDIEIGTSPLGHKWKENIHLKLNLDWV